MAMEIQIMRRTGYAMKIKTPAEAVGRPFCHESEHRIGFWSVWWLDFTGGGAGRISKNKHPPSKLPRTGVFLGGGFCESVCFRWFRNAPRFNSVSRLD
jgi:hypothetical protein